MKDKYRVMQNDEGLIIIEKLTFWVWWRRVFSTYNDRGALAFLSMTDTEYNEDTGYYE